MNSVKYIKGNTSNKKIRIDKRKIGKITFYEVTESELSILENGNDGGVWLNIALMSFSISITTFISYFTCDFKNKTTEGGFLAVAICFSIFGITLLLLYLKSKKKTEDLYREIRNR